MRHLLQRRGRSRTNSTLIALDEGSGMEYSSAELGWPDAALERRSLELSFRGETFVGHLVAPGGAEPRPLVLVIHNYQGLKGFDVQVAEYLARVGYVGLAIDLYGNDVPVHQRDFPDDMSQVEAYQRRCFEAMVRLDHDYERFRALLGAWRDLGMTDSSVDHQVSPGAMGYCLGGVAVLEAVRGGLDFSAVVSFHGLLQTGEDPSPSRFGVERAPLRTCPNVHNTKTVIRIENGAHDHLVPDSSKQRFYEEMDTAGVDWTFHEHAKAPHGFALPSRLGPPGHLHEAADRRSTQNMLSLFREVFPNVEQQHVSPNAGGSAIP